MDTIRTSNLEVCERFISVTLVDELTCTNGIRAVKERVSP